MTVDKKSLFTGKHVTHWFVQTAAEVSYLGECSEISVPT